MEELLRSLERSFLGSLPGRPRRILIEAGLFNQVSEPLLQEAFGIAAQESCWAGAMLTVKIVKPEVSCRSCGAKCPFPASACPGCGGTELAVAGGDAFVIREVEFDVEEN